MNPLLSLPAVAAAQEGVDDELLAAVAADDPFLNEMASHLIVAGGKRLRPPLAVAAGSCATGGDPVPIEVLRGGVAVELVQQGSLHHDDVIDEAVTRRNTDSVNARWGNLRAIISGDFLLARASGIAA